MCYATKYTPFFIAAVLFSSLFSFHKDTQVLIPTRESRAIEQVVVGDIVESFDGEHHSTQAITHTQTKQVPSLRALYIERDEEPII
jgi:hypothetical protein